MRPAQTCYPSFANVKLEQPHVISYRQPSQLDLRNLLDPLCDQRHWFWRTGPRGLRRLIAEHAVYIREELLVVHGAVLMVLVMPARAAPEAERDHVLQLPREVIACTSATAFRSAHMLARSATATWLLRLVQSVCAAHGMCMTDVRQGASNVATMCGAGRSKCTPE